MQSLLLLLLRVYKVALSPILGRQCRFVPSCADYANCAIQQYGAARGGMLALKRIGRCHPFSAGGIDPVPSLETRLSTTMKIRHGARYKAKNRDRCRESLHGC